MNTIYELLYHNIDYYTNLTTLTDKSLSNMFDIVNMPRCVNTEDTKLAHYSFFENCNIDEKIKNSIEKEFNYQIFLIRAATEDSSIFWLQKLFSIETCPIRKMCLLKLINDEYKHFFMFLTMLKNFYPHINIVNDYNFLVNKVNDNKKIDDEYQNILFDQFVGEVFSISELKLELKNSCSDQYKNNIKKILIDESNHLSLVKHFKDLFVKEEIKIKYKRKLYALIKILNKHKMSNFYVYKIMLLKHNIDINEHLNLIKTSNRSIDFISTFYKKIYKFAKDLTIIEDMSYDDFVKEAKINKS